MRTISGVAAKFKPLFNWLTSLAGKHKMIPVKTKRPAPVLATRTRG